MELLLSPEHLDEPDQVRVLQVLERVETSRIAAMLNFCMYMTIELSQLMLNLCWVIFVSYREHAYRIMQSLCAPQRS